MMPTSRIVALIALTTLFSCGNDRGQKAGSAKATVTPTANVQSIQLLDTEYWYSGKAELIHYDLRQNRYNGVHYGELIRIFVTEDFLTDEQVKNDTYTNSNSVSVLKMNENRRFTTGLYDYSIMTSVFTRADGSATEKITLSSQDWCGQSFVQINKNGNKHDVQVRSYFEKEGDKDFSLKADLLEDEVMNLLRISPELIPEGKVTVLPALTYLRFSHTPHEAIEASVEKSNYSGDLVSGGKLMQLEMTYPESGRTVTWIYDVNDMNKIIARLESRSSALDDTLRATSEVKVHELHVPYWKMNSASDTTLRLEFGLETY